jgi:hypothetical protein
MLTYGNAHPKIGQIYRPTAFRHNQSRPMAKSWQVQSGPVEARTRGRERLIE